MRGRKPICTDWRATEKAPEITAWEAMTVARVARMTSGISAHWGPGGRRVLMAAGSLRSSAPGRSS
jgi:hypothetical protein